MHPQVKQMIDRRTKVGISQTELARLCKFSTATLWRIEGGKVTPNLRTLDRIDKVLTEAESKRAA